MDVPDGVKIDDIAFQYVPRPILLVFQEHPDRENECHDPDSSYDYVCCAHADIPFRASVASL